MTLQSILYPNVKLQKMSKFGISAESFSIWYNFSKKTTPKIFFLLFEKYIISIWIAISVCVCVCLCDNLKIKMFGAVLSLFIFILSYFIFTNQGQPKLCAKGATARGANQWKGKKWLGLSQEEILLCVF